MTRSFIYNVIVAMRLIVFIDNYLVMSTLYGDVDFGSSCDQHLSIDKTDIITSRDTLGPTEPSGDFHNIESAQSCKSS